MPLLSATLVSLAVAAKFPAAMQSDIEYAREMCRALGQRFYIVKDHIETHDFNGDQQPDYILDGRGLSCGKLTDSLFGGSSGKPLYLYLSKKNGKWDKVFNAYAYEYNVKRDYGQLPFFDVWIRGEVGYQINYQRLQWSPEDKEMQIIKQEMGVEVPTQLWKNFD